ncbi:cytochrome-c oxidase, cbb3-type subunit III [Alteromonas pelagimontana]|uniref:Cbb3-type cytochrome c oxidase subunit n=1 Tax=Alteromonas pelagimontana TaxID=1858656 RepID=A0A6M4M7T7_9ALTE|nr:cytochrome-c oxidase, cbb3-type subunit III [Alteromonas pelagimontana]QJR79301.1 cytochrome-c oxidase, cbb3-type subunit III [Alteromonas pelagimontana]QJR82659.1 cytochrome-c oxidase, cbb3-type subunit III [Alteromonas pelagimontana]
MSMFWTIWISVLTLGTIFGCYFLLRWCLSNNTGVAEGEPMGHSFDGIEEINNPLPKWWTILFYVTMVFGLVYLLLFPGLGSFDGLLDWKSSNQNIQSLEESEQARIQAKEEGILVEYDRELEFAAEKFDPIFEAYAQIPVEELAKDPEAIKVGQRMFLQNCSQCHGSDARGQRGFPNLTDNDWLYGGTGDKIVETIVNGRQAAMPAWLDAMGEQGINEVVEYVLGLSGRNVDDELAAKGKPRFAVCSACHGPDGKGNQALGAPNLTDNIWLYGSTHAIVTDTVSYGRNGVMPSFKDRLGEDKIHVVASYVYSLSH